MYLISTFLIFYFFFFFNDTATTEIYTLSLHDALPIEIEPRRRGPRRRRRAGVEIDVRHLGPASRRSGIKIDVGHLSSASCRRADVEIDIERLQRRLGNGRTAKGRNLRGIHETLPRGLRLPAVERVRRIDRQSQAGSLFPLGASSAGRGAKLVFGGLERPGILANGVDLEQLHADGLATGILGQGVLENLLGLGIAAVGHVDVGFRDRIDLLGIELADLAEIALERT